MKRQIICISGNVAVGKTETSKIIIQKLGYDLYMASESFREMARKLNMDIIAFGDYVKQNPEIDRNIEATTAKNLEGKEHVIVDARMGFFVIPEAFKVYMKAELDIAAERLFKGSAKRGAEEKLSSVEEARETIIRREHNEENRYMDLYGVNIHDEDNYDYVIDTSYITPEEAAEKVMHAYNVWLNVNFNEG